MQQPGRDLSALVSSVNYRTQFFKLPKDIILDIERICPLNPPQEKQITWMSWEIVLWAKIWRRLLRRIRDLNEAALLKLVGKLLSCNYLWSSWIRDTYLKWGLLGSFREHLEKYRDSKEIGCYCDD